MFFAGCILVIASGNFEWQFFHARVLVCYVAGFLFVLTFEFFCLFFTFNSIYL